eukprot:TRINITY_DN27935_c0_g1_i1.p1 TRINITY_DN27935_c0_g1~~TRINITY_DN27935_c0_g1_i1.p1  ORF type:complete len:505 (-),score=47.87 TRINITY_DN27935_c0_g1_i1:171-1685(-)
MLLPFLRIPLVGGNVLLVLHVVLLLAALHVDAYRPSGVARQHRPHLVGSVAARNERLTLARRNSSGALASQAANAIPPAVPGTVVLEVDEQLASHIPIEQPLLIAAPDNASISHGPRGGDAYRPVAGAYGEPIGPVVAEDVVVPGPDGKPTVVSRQGAFDALDKENITLLGWMYAVAGGTGATIGSTGNATLDLDLVRRMRYQDEAVLLLLLGTYLLILGLSAFFTHREVHNTSPVTYYADPRCSTCAIESNRVEDFLEEFNQPPKDCKLDITGFIRTQTPDGLHGQVIEWNDSFYYVAFSFSLDLSPWVKKDVGGAGRRTGFGATEFAIDAEGVVLEDKETLQDFLDHNKNDMATVEMVKAISWSSWEELATNIRAQLRQSGFGGVVSIQRTEEDTLTIHKNKQWANFLHFRTLKILCALSVLGWLVYIPYMYFRCTKSVVRSCHVVDISIDEYWPLVADHLQTSGFERRQQPTPGPSPQSGAWRHGRDDALLTAWGETRAGA